MSSVESNGYITRDCPNCGHSRNNFLRKVESSRPLEKMNWDEAKKYFVGFRFKQPFFTYIECASCNLLYCPTYFNQSQLNELYGSMPDNLAGESEEIIGKTQRKYIDYLSSKCKGLTLLEIGADIGLVTKEFIRRFDTHKVIAIEPNKDVHQRFKDNLKSKDKIDAQIYTDINEITTAIDTDVVIGIHVFDHLIEPNQYLKTLNELMRADGNILIIVHDEKSLLSKILQSKWPPFCPQHPHLFNSKTLSKILIDLGFSEIKSYKTTNWFSIGHVVKLMGTIFGIKLELSVLDRIQLPLKLGNMAVTAKKI
jgi:hypothetical protein